MKKLTLAVAMLSAMVATTANAADHGHGSVKFTGSIIDAPCSIAPENIDQTVDMGEISNQSLKNGGTSPKRYFSIKLENCDVSALENKTVSITFTGHHSDLNANNLAISGSASGASIGIISAKSDKDKNGTKIKLDQPSNEIAINNGNPVLQFAAYLQGDAVSPNSEKSTDSQDESLSSIITPGEFTATTNFVLDYQ
ncbi:hypothetical protein BL250_15090 [Erwinia sp. OLTSP20]|nr:hypothetical protein BV501_18090 [Erwinia sp. OAMSP11]PIJ67061.1 hypothetical protein BK416_17130 [Erwinia sp. OLSSP12]PIJ78368.1 hypothetical protein BLD47_17260 [Erwinia sp. OLCASP19]PIJ79119.1 hypothetical protein BLD46_17320 [Erwinia sp. OLMTSP26]PIJ79976.1 hypothetical protein BLD49_17270 [Erwinia sp. OLMDSP33]PIJ89776.1 hypothetical protein BL250_15090 [Erwinia sp. OLTSP20]PIJ92584.1 hypothetical protein BL249_06220 [Erwinia sp. OLFS4]